MQPRKMTMMTHAMEAFELAPDDGRDAEEEQKKTKYEDKL
jgi:hypothetical protein